MMNHNALFYFFVHLGPRAQLSLRECVLLLLKPLTLLGRGTGLQRMVMAFSSRSSSLCCEESLVFPWRSVLRGETYSVIGASYTPSISTAEIPSFDSSRMMSSASQHRRWNFLAFNADHLRLTTTNRTNLFPYDVN